MRATNDMTPRDDPPRQNPNPNRARDPDAARDPHPATTPSRHTGPGTGPGAELSPVATLFLVRHGETVWHAENRYTGSSDIALTPLGDEQAGALGRWAATARLDAIVTSPLSRARRTAAPAQLATGLPQTVEDGLREVDFGIAEGRTLTEVAAEHPQAVEEFLSRPATCPLPGGDDPVTAAARAAAALWRIAERFARSREDAAEGAAGCWWSRTTPSTGSCCATSSASRWTSTAVSCRACATAPSRNCGCARPSAGRHSCRTTCRPRPRTDGSSGT